MYNLKTIITDNIPKDIPLTGDKGIKLIDVKNGKNTMEEFVAQLNETELDSEIEWGRVTGGYPKVITDLSDEPLEVAEHIKITNPKNKDLVTLLYPRKNSQNSLITETAISFQTGFFCADGDYSHAEHQAQNCEHTN